MVRRQLLDRRIAFQHVADVVGNGKHSASFDMRVEMRRVGRDHHVAAFGLDPHALQALGVAADPGAP